MHTPDLIASLDNEAPGWRDAGYKFNRLLQDDIGFRADLTMAFLQAEPEYLDDIVPAIIGAPYIVGMDDDRWANPKQPKYSPIEWVIHIMDNARSAAVVEDTAAQIAQYISSQAFDWLLEEEERAIAI